MVSPAHYRAGAKLKRAIDIDVQRHSVRLEVLLQLNLGLVGRLHRLLSTRLIQIHLQVVQGK